MTGPSRFGSAEILAVVVLCGVGLGLRFWHLDAGWFGVDQARDVQTALDVAHGRDWPTVGPTMRRVTSLGALYYYAWAVPFLVSDDPLAGYRFAAGLGVVALLAAWAFARRAWGVRAGLVTLAVFATSRVAVIDGRVMWAPAALPAVAMLLLWLLAGPPTVMRVAALGAVLGVAVQLHLAMAAWVLAAAGVVLLRRAGGRAIAAGIAAGIVSGFPALYAALTNAGRDAGITTLPTRGPVPSLAARLSSAWSLEWQVPTAFWQWPDTPEPWPAVTRAAAATIALAVAVGVVRLARDAFRAHVPAAVLLAVIVCQLTMVALLPGEAWYYYLDALLPAWALAAGALVAVQPREGGESGGVLLGAVAVTLLVAAAWLGLQGGRWIAAAARHGYVALDPASLTLDGRGGRDAAAPGRLLSAGVKRDVARELAREPADFATRWLTTHGPAFDDVTGDNGFWLLRASAPEAVATRGARHTTVWYRDDPSAPAAATPGVELADVGPLRLARFVPAIDYASCRVGTTPIVVPVRVLPAPRRYGDGTTLRARPLPRRIDCALAPGRGGVRVVAGVTSGTVVVSDATGARGAAGPTSTLCLARGDLPASFALDVAAPADTAADLDLYEVPDAGCAGKIAP